MSRYLFFLVLLILNAIAFVTIVFLGHDIEKIRALNQEIAVIEENIRLLEHEMFIAEKEMEQEECQMLNALLAIQRLNMWSNISVNDQTPWVNVITSLSARLTESCPQRAFRGPLDVLEFIVDSGYLNE